MSPESSFPLIVLGLLALLPAGGGPPPASGTSGGEALALVPDSVLTIGRLQYDGGGDWYANPSSLANLLSAIRERTGLPVAPRERTVTPLDPALRTHPYLYLTGHGNVSFSEEEREALREYLLDGGFLHADDNYGLDPSFRREMAFILPERELVEIPPASGRAPQDPRARREGAPGAGYLRRGPTPGLLQLRVRPRRRMGGSRGPRGSPGLA